jgi:hypothetical protein
LFAMPAIERERRVESLHDHFEPNESDALAMHARCLIHSIRERIRRAIALSRGWSRRCVFQYDRPCRFVQTRCSAAPVTQHTHGSTILDRDQRQQFANHNRLRTSLAERNSLFGLPARSNPFGGSEFRDDAEAHLHLNVTGIKSVDVSVVPMNGLMNPCDAASCAPNTISSTPRRRDR